MKTLSRWFSRLLIAAVCTTGTAADVTKSLNGIWKPTQATLGGQPLPPSILKTISLKMDGAAYEVTVDTEKGKSVEKGTVVLDQSVRPKSMTVTGVAGPNAGKTFPAIYEFIGDTLRICYDLSGAKRPSEFISTPATKLYLVTYERAK